MAATTQAVVPARTANPLALWHLLSLDAPTVSALWTWFIARACHVRLPPAVPLAMALAVWILYAADRILDARDLTGDLEARHYFHRRHRSGFLAGIALVAVTLTPLLPGFSPASIHLYLIEGVLLAAWFLVLHATPSARRLPKEIVVGLFFSAAVFTPTLAREPALSLALIPVELLVAALCSLNCLFIHAWEHQAPAPHVHKPHAGTSFAPAHLTKLAVALVLVAILLALLPVAPAPIPAACALAALLLLLLDRNCRRFSRTTLRAAADLALLTPLLLLPFLLVPFR